ncbi:RNA-binding protein 34 [Cricetulus griseus]|nr:RNA-binding protein 34 [Cricetulus griseus]
MLKPMGKVPSTHTAAQNTCYPRSKGSNTDSGSGGHIRSSHQKPPNLTVSSSEFHHDQKSVNAYVVFKDERAATKTLQRNGAQIEEGFRIRVDLASETTSRDKRSVFVGNLPYKVEEAALEEHFLDCGSIVAVRILRNPQTGVGRGFGYVLFENTDAVHLALKLNNSELMGRKLSVMRSVNKEKLKQQNSNQSLKKRQ